MSLTFKRHYPLLVILLVATLLLTAGLGNQRIIAYSVPGTLQAETPAVTGTTYSGDVALFDDTIVHSIQVLMADGDFEQMLTTYRETGAKDYFHADVIIDGVQISNVGVRLKGNASLRTAVGGRMAGEVREFGGNFGWGDARPDPGAAGEAPFDPPAGQPPMRPEGQERPFQPDEGAAGALPPEGALPEGQAPAIPGGVPWDPENMPFQPGGDFGGGMGDGTTEVTVDTKIPLMLRFDETVEGQNYQGYTHLALRTYGTSNDAAMLQEPVTNAAARAIGLPVTNTAFASVQLNAGETQLYTLSEAINEQYLAEHFENSDGVLYKAELGSTLRYQGEDPSLYDNSFTQKTRVNDADLAPLIAFMRFLSEADDATFSAELPNYLDVEAFATYLALNNLLVNTDAIVGMNNNYYLYYDDVEQRFTLLMWDANESLGKLAMGGASASYDIYAGQQESSTSQMGGRMRGGMGGGSNTLAARFLNTPEFLALYEGELQRLYQELFVSGFLVKQVETYATLVRTADAGGVLVDPNAYEQAVARVLDFIAQRQAYLAGLPLFSETTTPF
ncbi:MAG: Inner spore coat protein H [Chloroflexi bacterium ADurb.Bin360]|nr:MAG: Inner spore coat protein H [Chloroflexi bacterium ADurb.Bin360]